MANKKECKLTYFLDHPQIKRYESVGNGQSPAPEAKPRTRAFLGGTSTSAQSGGVTQGTKGADSGTGNIKTNLGTLLSGGK